MKTFRYNVSLPSGKEIVICNTSATGALRAVCKMHKWSLREIRDTDNGWACGEVYSRKTGEHLGTADAYRIA